MQHKNFHRIIWQVQQKPIRHYCTTLMSSGRSYSLNLQLVALDWGEKQQRQDLHTNLACDSSLDLADCRWVHLAPPNRHMHVVLVLFYTRHHTIPSTKKWKPAKLPVLTVVYIQKNMLRTTQACTTLYRKQHHPVIRYFENTLRNDATHFGLMYKSVQLQPQKTEELFPCCACARNSNNAATVEIRRTIHHIANSSPAHPSDDNTSTKSTTATHGPWQHQT